MSLEATMLVLDNSFYSINGDYPPTRLAAQADAVHILFNNKLNANPENEVGLMVMAGKSPEVLVTPTQDEGKLIAALHETKQGGEADLSTGIQVAQLALKHRQNKNQRQRIIVFVGSPISASTASLVKLGKKMKKNNVAIDIISFGSALDSPLSFLPSSSSTTSTSSTPPEETNESKLQALHDAVNSSENSHFITVEPGPHLLSERIAASPIMRGEGGNDNEGGGGGGGGAGDYGVDPNMDPELAMALRMSLEEENARQAAIAAAAAAASSSSSAPLETVPEVVAPAPITSEESPMQEVVSTESAPTPVTVSEPKPASEVTPPVAVAEEVKLVVVEDVEMGEEEDEDLALALALSRGDEIDDEEEATMEDLTAEAEEDEDEEIARAIALSMQDQEEEK